MTVRCLREKCEPRTKCPVPWLDEKRGYLVDWLTQIWVKVTGRVVQRADHAWMDVPFGPPEGIGEPYFDLLARNEGLTVVRNSNNGLVADFSNLDSKAFDSTNLQPEVARFYEKTSEYELELWSQWCGLFRPFGWMVSYTFSRRLQQLNLPLHPLDAADGITSEIVTLQDSAGRPRHTGWFRTYRRTNEPIYVGFYSHIVSAQGTPLVRVAFPLPNGCAVVMLKAEAHPDGSLTLTSAGDGHGESGFYFLLNRDKKTVWVRHLRALTESIHVWAEGDNQLSAEHTLRMWGMPAMTMRYRMRRSPILPSESSRP